MSYKEDAKIDIDALDIEWLNQPDLERKYVEQVSALRKESQLADEEVKTVRSELISEANEFPEECCKKAKPNASDIEAYYRTHDKYKSAKEEFIKAQDALLVAQDMLSLIHFTRGKALEQLVSLHSQGYFAGPSAPRNINREIEKREEAKKIRKENNAERMKKVGSKISRKK